MLQINMISYKSFFKIYMIRHFPSLHLFVKFTIKNYIQKKRKKLEECRPLHNNDENNSKKNSWIQILHLVFISNIAL